MEVKKLAIIGAGFVGGPTGAVYAVHHPNLDVVVIDANTALIQAYQNLEAPFDEPGFPEILRSASNLRFSADLGAEVPDADIIFLTVQTPTKISGEGAGFACNLSFIESAIRSIASACQGLVEKPKIIVEKSTVPLHTADFLTEIIQSNSDMRFTILSNPEFLSEGSAINDLQNPDRVLIGSDRTEDGLVGEQTLVELYKAWVPEERIMTAKLWSSELGKLVSNAMLAQRISSINSISAICERTGADITEISKIVGLDTRIGPKFLNSGIGFAGPCLEKDTRSLVYIARSLGLDEVAQYWNSILDINNFQLERFKTKIFQTMKSLENKRVIVLGVTFKPNTSDTRGSLGRSVISFLQEEQAEVLAYDPRGLLEDMDMIEDIYEAATQASALVLVTEWKEFESLDFARIFAVMSKPAYFFDGRNLIDPEHLRKIGFRVFAIGRTD